MPFFAEGFSGTSAMKMSKLEVSIRKDSTFDAVHILYIDKSKVNVETLIDLDNLGVFIST